MIQVHHVSFVLHFEKLWNCQVQDVGRSCGFAPQTQTTPGWVRVSRLESNSTKFKSEFHNIFGVDSEWMSWTWTIVTYCDHCDWGPSPTRLIPQQGRNRHLRRWMFLYGAVFPGAWPEWRAASKSGLVGSPKILFWCKINGMGNVRMGNNGGTLKFVEVKNIRKIVYRDGSLAS